MRRALQLAAQPNEPWDSLSQILVLHDAALWIYRQAVMNSGYDHPVSVWVSLEEARLLLDCWTGLPDRNVMVRAAERMVRAGLGVDPEGVVS
jgi:hypothetical protein